MAIEQGFGTSLGFTGIPKDYANFALQYLAGEQAAKRAAKKEEAAARERWQKYLGEVETGRLHKTDINDAYGKIVLSMDRLNNHIVENGGQINPMYVVGLKNQLNQELAKEKELSTQKFQIEKAIADPTILKTDEMMAYATALNVGKNNQEVIDIYRSVTGGLSPTGTLEIDEDGYINMVPIKKMDWSQPVTELAKRDDLYKISKIGYENNIGGVKGVGAQYTFSAIPYNEEQKQKLAPLYAQQGVDISSSPTLMTLSEGYMQDSDFRANYLTDNMTTLEQKYGKGFYDREDADDILIKDYADYLQKSLGSKMNSRLLRESGDTIINTGSGDKVPFSPVNVVPSELTFEFKSQAPIQVGPGAVTTSGPLKISLASGGAVYLNNPVSLNANTATTFSMDTNAPLNESGFTEAKYDKLDTLMVLNKDVTLKAGEYDFSGNKLSKDITYKAGTIVPNSNKPDELPTGTRQVLDRLVADKSVSWDIVALGQATKKVGVLETSTQLYRPGYEIITQSLDEQSEKEKSATANALYTQTQITLQNNAAQGLPITDGMYESMRLKAVQAKTVGAFTEDQYNAYMNMINQAKGITGTTTTTTTPAAKTSTTPKPYEGATWRSK